MPDQPLRVSVVSAQEVFARGLSAMIGDHPCRLVLAEPWEADVVLYDVFGLHRADGADLDRLVRQSRGAIVAVSRDLRPDLRARALARGAHSWISMSVGSAELAEAVDAVAAGLAVPLQPDRLGEDAGLTAREVEVLALVTRGLTNQQIADRLFLSINSVKTYIRSAYAKIGVHSRTQAVAWCLGHGFAPPD